MGDLEMFEGRQRFKVGPGQSLLLWPGRTHGGLGRYPENLSFWWIHFRLPKRHKSAIPIRVPQTATVARPDRLTELFHRFIDDQEARSLTAAEGSLLVQLMLSELARPRPTMAGAPTYAHVISSRVAAQIDAALTDRHLSTAKIATLLDLNADYLNRAFKQSTGKTVTHQIHASRLKFARDLLRETLLNAKQIAQQCGFSNSTYFRRVFKRAEGVTPIAYRRRYLRLHINTR